MANNLLRFRKEDYPNSPLWLDRFIYGTNLIVDYLFTFTKDTNDTLASLQSQLDKKEPTITVGNLTDLGTDGITITNGMGAIIGSGTSLSQHIADGTHNGYLSSADWNTFNDLSGSKANVTLSNLVDPVAINKNLNNFSAGIITASLVGHASLDKAIATGHAYKFETTDFSGNLQETAVSPNSIVVTDSNGLPTVSLTTLLELSYLSGVTSSVQTQLNGLRLFKNIKTDFGAIGNGIADDTAAINNGLASGFDLFFPTGTYLTTGNHTVSTQYITGLQKNLVTIKRSSGTNPIFTLTDSGTIEGFTLDGNSLGGSGIIVSGSSYGNVKKIAIKNIAGTSYALQLTGGSQYLTLEDLEFHSNYGHIYLANVYYSDLLRTKMFGATDSAFAIKFDTGGVTDINFDDTYLESSVNMTTISVRDIRFNNVRVRLDSIPGAWWQATNTAGGGGSEVAQITISHISVLRNTNNIVYPVFDVNSHELFLNDIHVVDNVSSAGWNFMKDRGTRHMRLQDVTIESTNSWNLFDSTSTGGTFLIADSVNYTQGVIGTASWSNNTGAGETSGHIIIRNSNLNHNIQGAGARNYTFEHIFGNIDLTNASANVWLWDVKGTITDPNFVAIGPDSLGGTFTGQTLSTLATTNQLILGTSAARTATLTAPTPATASRTYTFPDQGANYSIVATEGSQTINGNKTISGTTNLSGLTASLPLQLDGSKNIISTAIVLSGSQITGTLGVGNGGTGQTSYTNGQLLIGNTTSNTLTKAALTGTANQIVITNGNGSITLSTPQDINTTSSPTFVGLTLSGNLTFSTSGDGIVGTTTNDNASAGKVGEYIESVISTNTSVGTTGQYFDATSISLTAGDWDVEASLLYKRNGATFTSFDLEIGISTTSGNSATGLVEGNNYLYDFTGNAGFLDWLNWTVTIPEYRISLSTTTTVYLKSYVDHYTAGTPQFKGKICARRVR